MAKQLKKALKRLESLGFRLEYNDGTRMKVFPPDKTKQFYSLHFGDKAYKPFASFARKEWQLDLETL